MPIPDEPTKTGATMIEKPALIIATDIAANKGDIKGRAKCGAPLNSTLKVCFSDFPPTAMCRKHAVVFQESVALDDSRSDGS